jgi:two-component system, NarL family, response regulator DegU
MKKISVLIADDEQNFRMILSAWLRCRPNVVVVGEAVDGIDVVEKTEKLNPDVVFMDITMPRCDGLDATRILKWRWPNKKVVITSNHDQQFYRKEAQRARADGYIFKSSLNSYLNSALGQGPSLLSMADDVVDVRVT